MTTEYTQNFGLALPDFRMGPWHDLVNQDLTKIDALLFSALSGQDVAVWQHNTIYTQGLTVLDDTDASIWMCSVNHTSALTGTFLEDRTAHPTYWVRLLTGFAPRGEWTNDTNYFPYDMVFDANLGIMGLCSLKHTSNVGGSIKDDELYWAFLIDMSEAELSSAIAVSYSNATSGLPATNVQAAIDQLEVQIVSLNNVNITQGNNITALQSADTTHNSRLTAIESKNTTQDTTLASLQTQINTVNTRIDNLVLTFPAGTKMTFIQAVPPTGWTGVNGLGNRAIRLVDQDGSGGNSGGSIGFTTIFQSQVTGAHTLTTPEMPSHTHPPTAPYLYFAGSGLGSYGLLPQDGLNPGGVGVSSGPPSSGSDGSHTHALDFRLAYVNACIGQKS